MKTFTAVKHTGHIRDVAGIKFGSAVFDKCNLSRASGRGHAEHTRHLGDVAGIQITDIQRSQRRAVGKQIAHILCLTGDQILRICKCCKFFQIIEPVSHRGNIGFVLAGCVKRDSLNTVFFIPPTRYIIDCPIGRKVYDSAAIGAKLRFNLKVITACIRGRVISVFVSLVIIIEC